MKQLSEVETLVCMKLSDMVNVVEYNILARGGSSVLEHIRTSLINTEEGIEWGEISIGDLASLNNTIYSYDIAELV